MGTSLWSCLEEYYGIDNLLVNGRPYRPTNTRAARYPYFLADEWTEGAVYVKGRKFSPLTLKYNLEIDRPILKQQLKNGASANVVLTENLVDSFRIGQHLFVNSALLPGKTEDFGFLEKIYSGECSFFKKQKKVFIANYSGRTPHGKFSEAETTFFLLIDDQLQTIPNRKAFLDFFAPHQTNVKKYMNQKGIQLKKASGAQLRQLLAYCDLLE